jgi:hypothetical protein
MGGVRLCLLVEFVRELRSLSRRLLRLDFASMLCSGFMAPAFGAGRLGVK